MQKLIQRVEPSRSAPFTDVYCLQTQNYQFFLSWPAALSLPWYQKFIFIYAHRAGFEALCKWVDLIVFKVLMAQSQRGATEERTEAHIWQQSKYKAGKHSSLISARDTERGRYFCWTMTSWFNAEQRRCCHCFKVWRVSVKCKVRNDVCGTKGDKNWAKRIKVLSRRQKEWAEDEQNWEKWRLNLKKKKNVFKLEQLCLL